MTPPAARTATRPSWATRANPNSVAPNGINEVNGSDVTSPTVGLGQSYFENIPILAVLGDHNANGEPHLDKNYPGYDFDISDQRRAKEFIKDFDRMVATGRCRPTSTSTSPTTTPAPGRTPSPRPTSPARPGRRRSPTATPAWAWSCST